MIKTHNMLRNISISFVLTLALAASSQTATHSYDLLLKNGNYTVDENFRQLKVTSLPGEESVNGNYYRWIQFYEIPDAPKRKELELLGVQLYQYLPAYTYIAAVYEKTDLTKLGTYGIRSVFVPRPEYKMSPELFNKEYPVWALKGNGKIDLNFIYYDGLDYKTVMNMMRNNGFELLEHDAFGRVMRTRISIADINKLAEIPYVTYVECVEMPPVADNVIGKALHRSNTLNTSFPGGRNYDGSGMKIAMGDDGIIGPHIDYSGRVDMSNVPPNEDNGNHGDHIAGTIMGAGNIDPKARGMAPAAELWVYLNMPYYDENAWKAVNSTPTSYISPGIRVTSTSYSNGCNTGYTSHAVVGDKHIRQMPSLMHVFSAGNDGQANCGYGSSAPGFGNITGGIKMGKNCITVGNVDDDDALDATSSRGPATDGRIKPDVCGMGYYVYSTLPVNKYGKKLGTSMSTPGVAGSYALLFQAAKEITGSEPKSGLLKDVLLNTCDDIDNVGPDFKTGWGRVNLLRAVKCIEQGKYMSDSLDQGQTKNHSITVPAGTKQLRVMLYWPDYEAAADANPALVNDLDFEVSDPSAAKYLPWVLDHTPQATKLKALAVRKADHMNNMEQVTIDNPPVGQYTLTVKGTTVPKGLQPYFISYELRDDSVTVTYPIGAESLVPGETEPLRWDAYGTSGTFNIDYSTDNGQNWTSVTTGVAGTKRVYDWVVPSSITNKALIRVTRGTYSDVSDAPFNIMAVPESLTIAWACSTIFRLQWNAVTGASSYEAYMLGAKYMDSQGTTNNTYFDFTNGVNGTDPFWVSVRAIGPNGEIGRRAYAISKSPGVFSCPPGAGIDENNPENSISLFPNPSGGIVNYSVHDLKEELTITVKDIHGRSICNITKASPQGQINLTQASKGLYFIEFEGGDNVYHRRFVKE